MSGGTGERGFMDPTNTELIVFDSKASGQNGFGVGDISPTLRAMNHKDSHQNAGGQCAVAFRVAGQEGFTPADVCPPGGATDGGGAGVPTICFDTTQITSASNYSNPQPGDPCHPVAASSHPPAVMTLAIRGRQGDSALEAREDGLANAILTPNGGRGGIGVGAVAIPPNEIATSGEVEHFTVRRLTVIEVARLQGFPDLYAHIETKSRRRIELDEAQYLTSHGLNVWQEDGQWLTNIASDGPMYRAFGNSQAVPVVRWIGLRMKAALEARDKSKEIDDEW
jgi:DNA (cytosine-5)-methyltransferase 1